ncbi:hypothetical protein FOL47_007688 [Perkinsus chesapeaki]|uniref:Uncharacterized protein n=1 Tax=Perkinsus chesapeaki TaxID=330153 RepID=A0A7J6LJY7_PERCH|nr:hypothetical protein FOL47_007688 [Perkinsus chesapeaki]
MHLAYITLIIVSITAVAQARAEGRHHRHHAHHTRLRHKDDDNDLTVTDGSKPDPDAVLANLTAKTRRARDKLKKDVLIEKQVHSEFQKELKGLEPLEKRLDAQIENGGDDDEGSGGASFVQEGSKSSATSSEPGLTLESLMKTEDERSTNFKKGLDNWYAGFENELANFVKGDGDQLSPEGPETKVEGTA